VRVFVHRQHRYIDKARSNGLLLFAAGAVQDVEDGLGAQLLLDHPTKFCGVPQDSDGKHACKQPALTEDTSVVEAPNRAMPMPGKPSPQKKAQAQAARKRSGRARRAGVGQSKPKPADKPEANPKAKK
jgi:hypothetical protein